MPAYIVAWMQTDGLKNSLHSHVFLVVTSNAKKNVMKRTSGNGLFYVTFWPNLNIYLLEVVNSKIKLTITFCIKMFLKVIQFTEQHYEVGDKL